MRVNIREDERISPARSGVARLEARFRLLPWPLARVVQPIWRLFAFIDVPRGSATDARREATTSLRNPDCFLLPADILVCRQGHRNGDVISLWAISLYGSRDCLLQKKRGFRSSANQEFRHLF